MQTVIGSSMTRDASAAVKEATQKIVDPNLIMFISSYETLKAVAGELKAKYPGVPCIGTSGTSYFETNASDQNLVVIAFGKDARCKVGVLRYLSTCPLYDIMDLKKAVSEVEPGDSNTVCLEFCTNDEERLVTTMNVALEQKKIPLVGGTVFGYKAGDTPYVCVNGELYTDACCYAVVKNMAGKVHTYSENIYCLRDDAPMHIATKVNLANKELVSLDNRPAADVYGEELNLQRSQIVDNVLENPLGRVIGDKVYICSPYKINDKGVVTIYKRINENDTISILQLQDYDAINADTREKIHKENPRISFIFSVNCIYRHLLFTQKNHLPEFMKDMRSLGPHVGVVGGGEQYKTQHVNQTMVCAVFD